MHGVQHVLRKYEEIRQMEGKRKSGLQKCSQQKGGCQKPFLKK